jgi:peptide deformylase
VLLPIIVAPDPRLKVKSTPVERVDDELRKLMDDMLESMYAAPGIGLSAVQVGIMKRVIVVDVTRQDEEPTGGPHYLINPKIIWAADEDVVFEEGCLSLPDQFADIARPNAVKIRHLDYAGEERELEAEGVLATCIQHEMDHLKGILFVDHLSAMRRNIILRKLLKARKQKAAASA